MFQILILLHLAKHLFFRFQEGKLANGSWFLNTGLLAIIGSNRHEHKVIEKKEIVLCHILDSCLKIRLPSLYKVDRKVKIKKKSKLHFCDCIIYYLCTYLNKVKQLLSRKTSTHVRYIIQQFYIPN